MGAISDLAMQIGASAAGWLFVFALLTALELAAPRGGQSLGQRFKGLAFWALWIPVTVATYSGCAALWRMLGIEPLVVLSLDMGWSGALAVIAAPLAGAFVGDFFFYWFHRGQHAFFWRFHAVHHSIRDLSAVNSYHHVSEAAIHTLLYVIPTSLIVADTGPVLPVVALILSLQPVFLHSPTRLHFGPLRALLADNRFHRIHHSLEPRHFDRNFGAFTTLWDRLFGTAHFPAADEWPDTGLAEVAEPASVREWLDLPWRFGQRRAAQAEALAQAAR